LRPKAFKFENYWVKIPCFKDVVQEAWDESTIHPEPCQACFSQVEIKNDQKKTKKMEQNFQVQHKCQASYGA
jgi:hypothetical protein